MAASKPYTLVVGGRQCGFHSTRSDAIKYAQEIKSHFHGIVGPQCPVLVQIYRETNSGIEMVHEE